MEESKKEVAKKEQESINSTMKVQCKIFLNSLNYFIEDMIKSGMKVTSVGADG
jgi:hypothetical protein